ncbi:MULTISPECIES: HAD family hydrolase [unclassified Streptomyces]|uniref:HAD family hydrolase n=1 Tax=unclassified Streptomyces TaxID=2593676 RepID=UPI000BF7FF18|nr:HAD-IA family hydrolase [Streptomyces sp. Ru87]PGH51857.1 hydrolase [Streptomyces sp. Ru87]
MAIKGVLFDFSGTLFRIEPAESWLRTSLARLGITVPEPELARWAARLEDAGALPGGSSPRELPPRLAGLWAERDRTADRHRELYTELAREAGLPWPEAYEVLYDRHMEPDAWIPYPDAAEVLGALRERGTAVAVVSNIGWDLRPVFRGHGLDRFVDAYALSYEHGVQKPEAGLFEAACAALGTEPGETLMVGDDARADGGATALGCSLELVRHLPAAERPDGLRPVLARLD